ncbi:anti-sigma factor [Acidicapsa acidisoli]|uniref:anti-sigma factor n=1 Tax=Acidicapsa acidisoli TaxID=1615681 RepID=UPI0021E0C657|nr:anti-sigma factor [Acidicapsa acidisoli]
MQETFHISEEDLIQYALGTLKEGQLSQFTAHISTCNQCRGELARTQVELACFAAVQPTEDLPQGARERFLQRLNSDTAPDSRLVSMHKKSRLYITSRSFQNWLETPLPLRILSGILAASLAFVAYDDLSHIHQIRQLLPAMNRYEKESANFTELKEFLRGTDTQQVSLHPKPAIIKTPEGHAIYSAASGKLVFTAANLPAPPPGKAYELWVLPAAGGAPIPAGVFTPDLQGSAAVIFPDIPSNVQAAGFGVTVEDAAGSPKPTSAIILSGQ